VPRPGKKAVWTILWIALGAALALPFLVRRTLVFYTDGAKLREPEELAMRSLRDVL